MSRLWNIHLLDLFRILSEEELVSELGVHQADALPPEIAKLYISLLGEESSEVFACTERFPEFFVRVNTLKKPKPEVIRRLDERGLKLAPLSWFR